MGLKDLIAQRSSLNEAAIEEVVKDYVRYDPEQKAIVLLPAAARLPNKNKVLIYLVALQGWPFVSDDDIEVDAKPAEITDATGIQGGSLRPTLKELKDGHVIAEQGGRYSVRTGSLSAIRQMLSVDGGGIVLRRTRRKADGAAAQSDEQSETDEAVAKLAEKKPVKKPASRKSGLVDQFDGWIAQGFFDQRRTLADVQKKFAKEGVIVPRTSIPGMLLRAVHQRTLERDEADVDGKNVWIYMRRKK
jgi:hypothetical protein